MKITGAKLFRIIVILGITAGLALTAFSTQAGRTVHAAVAPEPRMQPLLAHAGQVASPENQNTQAGLPPNLDWTIFLPPGEGQFQATVFCNSCHSAKVIVTRRSDAAGWEQIVRRMVDMHQASVQVDDIATLSKYLGDTLSPTTPVLNVPLHINTMSKEEMNFLGLLPPEAIQKIIDARTKGKIKDFATLETIIGDKNIEKYKGVIAFD